MKKKIEMDFEEMDQPEVIETVTDVPVPIVIAQCEILDPTDPSKIYFMGDDISSLPEKCLADLLAKKMATHG